MDGGRQKCLPAGRISWSEPVAREQGFVRAHAGRVTGGKDHSA